MSTEGVMVGLFKRRKRNKAASSIRLHSSNGMDAAPRILFVSHEATRTGAPHIILNILRHFERNTFATLQTILHSGGFLAEEFVRHSETDCLNLPRQSSDELVKRIRRICGRYHDDPPQLAICNSMESRHVAYELYRLGIPVIFLIHELPSSYDRADFQQVFDCSRRIIFPADVVRDAINHHAPVPMDKVHVLPQGLLNPEFGKRANAETARKEIRAELGVSPDAFLVLGCGTLDLRKGIDHFASVARTMLERRRVNRPVHFVWLGEGDRWVHTPYHYTMLDIHMAGTQNHVHFIGERSEVENWFVGSDAFFLSSRVDPFPCVVHEAMASQIPVIVFDKSGGAVAAVADGAGLVAPYGDYECVSSQLEAIANQPAVFQLVREKALNRVRTQFRFDLYAERIVALAEEQLRCRIARSPIIAESPVRRNNAA